MRLFFACWIPQEWAKACLYRDLEEFKKIDPDLKFVEPHLWHLTMAFLGEMPESSIPTLKEIGKNVAMDTPVIELRPKGFGVFGGKKNARVFWLGFAGETFLLERLAEKLHRRLKENNFPSEDRKFVPHLTLARARKGKFIREELTALCSELKTGGVFHIREMALVKSVLTPRGPLYENICTFSFKG